MAAMTKPLSMDQAFVKRLTEIVLDNLPDENFNVDQLAKAAGMSHATLHRRLRAIKNQDVTHFIREVRLHRAMELLRQNAGNASEVAFKVLQSFGAGELRLVDPADPSPRVPVVALGGVPVVDGRALVVGERDGGEHPLQVVLGLEQLGLGGAFGGVEVAAGAGHPVLALLEEAVAAPAVPEVVVLPGLAVAGRAGGDGVAVDQDLDGAEVAGEVAGLGVGLGQRVRADLGVVLGGGRGAVSRTPDMVSWIMKGRGGL